MSNITKIAEHIANNPKKLQEQIHIIAKDSINIKLSDHAKQRMKERDFVMRDVLDILRNGVVEKINKNNNNALPECKIVAYKFRGCRDAGVITIVKNNNLLLVKTVEWEDWRN